MVLRNKVLTEEEEKEAKEKKDSKISLPIPKKKEQKNLVPWGVEADHPPILPSLTLLEKDEIALDFIE